MLAVMAATVVAQTRTMLSYDKHRRPVRKEVYSVEEYLLYTIGEPIRPPRQPHPLRSDHLQRGRIAHSHNLQKHP